MKTKLLVAVLLAVLLPYSAAATEKTCELPEHLQAEISRKYPGQKLVGLSDLDEHDRGLFQKEHGDACPGLVSVDFYGDGKPTVALVLIGKGGATEKAELIVARRLGESWSTTLLDSAKDSVPVVWKQEPGEYKDIYGKKKLSTKNPVIVLCGYEAWAILYAWADHHVTKIWLSD
jgi:hypothetical protein